MKEYISPVAIMVYLGLFGTLLLAVTIVSLKRASKSIEDYLVAGRTLGAFTFFFYASFGIISAWTIYGYPGFMSFTSIAFNAYHLAAGFGIGLVTYWWLGYRLMAVGKLYNFNSPLEALGDRYQSHAIVVVVTLIFLIFIIPYVGLQFIAVTVGMKAASPNFQYNWGALFMLVMTIAYIGFGGLRSAAWVTTACGFVAFVAVYACFLALYPYLPEGLTGAANHVLATKPMLLSMPGLTGIYTESFTFGLALGGLLYFAPHMLVGIMGARGKASISAVVYGMPIICVLIYTVVCWMAIYYAPMLMPGLKGKGADAIIQNMVTEYLPTWFSVIFLMGVLAFAIKTAALQLWAGGTFFMNDVYLRFIDRKASYRRVRIVNLVFLTLLALLSCGLALWRPEALALYLTKLAGPGFIMAAPMLAAAFYWPRANKYGALAGLIGGTVYLILELFFFKWLSFGFQETVAPLALNIILLVVVSLLTPKMDTKITEIRWKTNVTNFLEGKKLVPEEPSAAQ